jgi:hypothetical protein
MITYIETQLTIKDLESYITDQLEDSRYSGIRVDPILDIILHCKRRLANGDYMPRVVSEAMVCLDGYLLDYAGFETCVP